MAKVEVILRKETEYAEEYFTLTKSLDDLYDVFVKLFEHESKNFASAADYIAQARERLYTAINYMDIELHRRGAYELVKTEDE